MILIDFCFKIWQVVRSMYPLDDPKVVQAFYWGYTIANACVFRDVDEFFFFFFFFFFFVDFIY